LWLIKWCTCRPVADMFLVYSLAMSLSYCPHLSLRYRLSQAVISSHRALPLSNDIGYLYALTLSENLNFCWDVRHFSCRTEQHTPGESNLSPSRIDSSITSLTAFCDNYVLCFYSRECDTLLGLRMPRYNSPAKVIRYYDVDLLVSMSPA